MNLEQKIEDHIEQLRKKGLGGLALIHVRSTLRSFVTELKAEVLEEVENKLEDALTIENLEAHNPQAQFIAQSMGDAMKRQIMKTLQTLKPL